jgi:hypothetical protein
MNKSEMLALADALLDENVSATTRNRAAAFIFGAAAQEPVAYRIDWTGGSIGLPRFFGADEASRMSNMIAFQNFPHTVIPLCPGPVPVAAQPEPVLTGGDERRHIICLCPDCTKPAQPEPLNVTPDMVSRFLTWELPRDFYPDCGVVFKRYVRVADGLLDRSRMGPGWCPTGTNLLTAEQARAMLEQVRGIKDAP